MVPSVNDREGSILVEDQPMPRFANPALINQFKFQV
jgi:hypothetical protein